MQEFVMLRDTPMIDPSLHAWGWEIPLYLFLGGIAAGVMILSPLLLRRYDGPAPSVWLRLLPFSAPALISIGMLFLFLDLEYKAHVFRFYLFFRPASPMSWGAWILVLLYPATLLMGLAAMKNEDLQHKLIAWLRPLLQPVRNWAEEHRQALFYINIVLGAGLGIYTGILLGSLGARPLWNSTLLGPLFLVSGISTGAAFMMLFPVSHEDHEKLVRWDILAIIFELALLILFLIGQYTSSSAANQQAVELLVRDRYTAEFWSLVVIGGLLVPLALKLIEMYRDVAVSKLAPILILIGGLSLRWIFVLAGQINLS